MDSILSSSPSESRTKPIKQFICHMCSKTFDTIETLDSHKRLEHSESKPPAGVG